jgi:predicted ribosomally synthesized peptide with nif11-like leader
VGDLIAFARASDQDLTLQAILSAAESPQAIIQIAQESGFSITLGQLKQAAPDLSAAYWPWSGKGFRFRSQFFRG